MERALLAKSEAISSRTYMMVTKSHFSVSFSLIQFNYLISKVTF